MGKGPRMLADHMALVLVARTNAALTLELAVERMVEEMLKLVDYSAACQIRRRIAPVGLQNAAWYS